MAANSRRLLDSTNVVRDPVITSTSRSKPSIATPLTPARKHEDTVCARPHAGEHRSEALGLASCHVGLEVDYRGEAKIVEVVKFDRIPSWEKIAFEVEMWIDRNDPWSWQGEATH